MRAATPPRSAPIHSPWREEYAISPVRGSQRPRLLGPEKQRQTGIAGVEPRAEVRVLSLAARGSCSRTATRDRKLRGWPRRHYLARHSLHLDRQLNALPPERRYQGRHARRGKHAGIQEFHDGVGVVGRQLTDQAPVPRPNLDAAARRPLGTCGLRSVTQQEPPAHAERHDRCWVAAAFGDAKQVSRAGKGSAASLTTLEGGGASACFGLRRAGIMGLSTRCGRHGRCRRRVGRRPCKAIEVLLQWTLLPGPGKATYIVRLRPSRVERAGACLSLPSPKVQVQNAGRHAAHHSVRIRTRTPCSGALRHFFR